MHTHADVHARASGPTAGREGLRKRPQLTRARISLLTLSFTPFFPGCRVCVFIQLPVKTPIIAAAFSPVRSPPSLALSPSPARPHRGKLCLRSAAIVLRARASACAALRHADRREREHAKERGKKGEGEEKEAARARARC